MLDIDRLSSYIEDIDILVIKRDVVLTYYTTDIVVFEIYTKRYTYLGKGAIVRGFASHYNIFSKFVYLLVYISNTTISVV